MPGADLNGARVLIAEDEYYFAEDLAGELRAAGASPIGPFATLAEAVSGVDAADAAVLDVRLSGELAEDLALLLQERAIPFVVVTGYSESAIPLVFRSAPRLAKPCASSAVVAEIARLLGGGSA